MTIEDCFTLSQLTADESDAIAEHDHDPEVIAAELGAYLTRRPDGRAAISEIILDDIALAQGQQDYAHSAKLKLVLETFVVRFGGSVRTLH